MLSSYVYFSRDHADSVRRYFRLLLVVFVYHVPTRIIFYHQTSIQESLYMSSPVTLYVSAEFCWILVDIGNKPEKLKLALAPNARNMRGSIRKKSVSDTLVKVCRWYQH